MSCKGFTNINRFKPFQLLDVSAYHAGGNGGFQDGLLPVQANLHLVSYGGGFQECLLHYFEEPINYLDLLLLGGYLLLVDVLPMVCVEILEYPFETWIPHELNDAPEYVTNDRFPFDIFRASVPLQALNFAIQFVANTLEIGFDVGVHLG